MSKEQGSKPERERASPLSRKVLKWAIIIGGAAVGLQWILKVTSGI